MIRRLVVGVLVLVVLTYLVVLGGVQWAFRARTGALREGSAIATTAAGPVEYAREGSGPPVLVLPGSFGGYDQALMVGRSLVGEGYTLVAVSRPGYLRTPLAVGATPAEQAAAMVALLDSLGIRRAAVLGVSGGGPAALELASRHPDRVAGLILIAALTGPKAQPPGPKPASTWGDRLFGSEFSTWWMLRSLERSGTAALAAPIFSDDTRRRLTAAPALLDQYFQLAWFRFPTALRWDGYQNDRAQFGAFRFEGFATISAPTLIVHGTLDRNAPIEHGDRAAASIGGAEYARIEGGDHFSSIARADEVRGRVRDLLGRAAWDQR